MTPLTNSEKQSRRIAELDAIAQAAGWQTWTQYATAVKRGVVRIERKPKGKNKMNFDKIAKQVREDGEDAIIAAAVQAEREACEQIALSDNVRHGITRSEIATGDQVAASIAASIHSRRNGSK